MNIRTELLPMRAMPEGKSVMLGRDQPGRWLILQESLPGSDPPNFTLDQESKEVRVPMFAYNCAQPGVGPTAQASVEIALLVMALAMNQPEATELMVLLWFSPPSNTGIYTVWFGVVIALDATR